MILVDVILQEQQKITPMGTSHYLIIYHILIYEVQLVP